MNTNQNTTEKIKMDTANTPPRWISEFGIDYNIPVWLDQKIKAGLAEDTSWHHDVSPSFTFIKKAEGKRIIIFVDRLEESRRETPYRFSIFSLDDEDELAPHLFCQTDDEAVSYLETRDVLEP